ncbi:MAG: hypothetical protein LAO21_11025 [Acidobacteriia bacterium]|nr:hypothetical protein [Terriglobia bacterium]
MWIFTTVGFFSVVQKPGEEFLTVRARVASDLNRLRMAYLPNLSATIVTKKGDYPYRATISHEDFAEGLARLGRDIHYGNFKNEVEKEMGATRERTYEEVWSLLRELEEEEGSIGSRRG